MDLLIGFILLIALAYGVTHLCGLACRGLGQLARLAVSRRNGPPAAPADVPDVGETAGTASA
jgi:hypothetical protein